jgi:hypothetical protein
VPHAAGQHGGGDHRFPGGGPAHGVHDTVRGDVLHEEADGTGAQHVGDVLIGVERRPRQHARRSGDPARRPHTAHAGHAQVHQHPVGPQPRDGGDNGLPVGRLAHHIDAAELEEQPQPLPHQGLVVDQQDVCHCTTHRTTRTGSADCVTSTVNRPSSAEAVSRRRAARRGSACR